MIFKFYSSEHGTEFIYIFTFQSGDIQITNAVNNNDISIKFTFQSGDIRIDKLESALYYYIDLHSNLVIFKCMSEKNIN